LVPTAPLGDSSLNIPLLSCFVKCFLPFFQIFSKSREFVIFRDAFRQFQSAGMLSPGALSPAYL
ncbi:MAG: hypothetical protein K2O45_08665, partial [Oscillospiraceae bacterium]|nr:hypothetical protein [Oscillospiraceae bacterium]